MKKLSVFILIFACLLTLTGCGREAARPTDRRPMILHDGVLYLDTGKAMPAEIDPSAIIGEINSTVKQSEIPTEDGQSNFGCVGSLYAMCEGGLAVMVYNEWHLFEAEEQSD